MLSRQALDQSSRKAVKGVCGAALRRTLVHHRENLSHQTE